MANEPAGVVYHRGPLPPVPPGPIASAVKQVTFASLNGLPATARGAEVRLSHDKGVELVIAHRSTSGRWQADIWVGKNWAKASSIEWTATAKVLW